jgi:hypothetical protein
MQQNISLNLQFHDYKLPFEIKYNHNLQTVNKNQEIFSKKKYFINILTCKKNQHSSELSYASVNLVHNAPVELPPARSFPLPTSVLYPVDPPPVLCIFHSDSLTRWSPPPVPLLYIINFPPWPPRRPCPPTCAHPNLLTHPPNPKNTSPIDDDNCCTETNVKVKVRTRGPE